MWRGVPAAAQTSGKASSLGSAKVGEGVRCPSGATPPIAKPVTLRTTSTSARDRASPASAAAFAGSTLLPPAVRNRYSRPLVPWKRIDLTIWSTTTPASAAAASAVRISAAAATTFEGMPAACSAAATRARDFDMGAFLFSFSQPPRPGPVNRLEELTLPPCRSKVRA